MSTQETFQKIFSELNDGGMVGNPAYNMQAVGQTFPQETKDWNSQVALEYRKFAMKKMEEQLKK